MSMMLALPFLFGSLAMAQKAPVDPITIYMTRIATPPAQSKEELKALATERKKTMDSVRKANFEAQKELRKQQGGDFKKWPADAQERSWDLEEATLQAADLWRETQGIQSDEPMRAKHEVELRKELSKRKFVKLVDAPDQADLTLEIQGTARLKIAAGARLLPLPPDRLDHTPLRDVKNFPYLELQHRYKASEPFWRFLCPNAWEQADVIDAFAKANHAVLMAARQ